MSVGSFFGAVQKFTTDNSPALLTGLGAAGVIATAVLTGKATIQATRIIDEEDARRLHEITYPEDDKPVPFKDVVKLTWKLYIPPLSMAAVTIGSIIMANRIGTRRAAAMAAAFTVVERNFEDYREQVKEKFGKSKEKDVHDDVIQKRVNEQPYSEAKIYTVDKDGVPFYDVWTGRYFVSTNNKIEMAFIKLNRHIAQHNYASLNDWYSLIGLSTIPEGDELGWNADHLVEYRRTTTVTDDDQPCFALDFNHKPIRGYSRAFR